MLDDAPPFLRPIDIISLSNVEDASTVIPSDIGLDGEFETLSCSSHASGSVCSPHP